MEQTANCHLSQWKGEDRILVEDFNADNAKVDAALKAEAEVRRTADEAETRARTAAVSSLSAALGKRGNCQLYITSYVGDGKYGASFPPRSITFPSQPQVVFISEMEGLPYAILIRGMKASRPNGYAQSTLVNAVWEGNTFSWYSYHDVQSAMNQEGKTYYLAALLAVDK